MSCPVLMLNRMGLAATMIHLSIKHKPQWVKATELSFSSVVSTNTVYIYSSCSYSLVHACTEQFSLHHLSARTQDFSHNVQGTPSARLGASRDTETTPKVMLSPWGPGTPKLGRWRHSIHLPDLKMVGIQLFAMPPKRSQPPLWELLL